MSVGMVGTAAGAEALDAVAATGRTSTVYRLGKRTFDLVVAAAALVALAPLMLVVGLAIWLDSPGPVIFRQQRVGTRYRHGAWEMRTFTLLKFRSMVDGADQTLHEQHVRRVASGESPQVGTDAPLKLHGDRRVTRVGRLLRRSSIDELPQLYNVLRGDMSLVGPRPVPAYEAELLVGEERVRFHAAPGITGLWQVRGRCAVTWSDMVRLDCEYVQQKSLLLDLRILFLTVPAVISGKGAR